MAGHKIPLDTHYNKSDYRLIRTDAQGEEQWNAILGRSWASHDYGESVVPSADGGFVIAGGSKPDNIHGPSLWVVKVDSGGDRTWDTTHCRPPRLFD
ncbi:MAG: hypothetical protein GF418_15295 [Chitinivibrionales bacterium]|nr:hypothetical protein [Chitinivibrionales bacterium]